MLIYFERAYRLIERRKYMKFSEIPYTRADIGEAAAKIKALAQKIRSAGTVKDVLESFRESTKIGDSLQTQASICYIRNTVDTSDKFYADEQAYYDSGLPVFDEAQKSLMLAMLESPFRAELEKELGGLMFGNAEIEQKAFSPEIIPDLQEENQLVTEYRKLIASAEIELDGETLTLEQLLPKKESGDREARKAAWLADGGFVAENAGKLDDIFDRLVKVRTRMAKKLGYENYVELGYYRMMRNCYGKRDIEAFRAAVKKHIVPLSARLKAEQAGRIGFDEMSLIDNEFMFKNGNAKPVCDPDGILAASKKMYRELSPETGRFIEAFFEGGMYDVVSKQGKAGGGYCTELPDYKMPFIFANFSGTADDVTTMTHEAGHAFAFYEARDIEITAYRNPTMETCEVHSMSMEYLTWPWAGEFFGGMTEKFKYTHLLSALNFIPYGTIVDYFQHIVYENPDMTPSERNDAWLGLERQFRPYLKLDGVPAYEEGRGWQRKAHIYELPFYYIDYCLAQTVALQFWALSQTDHRAAWEKYLAFIKLAGTKTFADILAGAGLQSPFGDGALAEVAEAASGWLDGVDAAGIDKN